MGETTKFQEMVVNSGPFSQYILWTKNKIVLSKICIITPKTGQMSHNKENNERKIRIVQEAAKLVMQCGCKIFILRNFIYNKINKNIFYLHGSENAWRFKFKECVQGYSLCQHMAENIRVRVTIVTSERGLVFTYSSLETETIIYRTPIGKRDHVTIVMDILSERVSD